MKASTRAMLDDIAFDKYGVIFSYLHSTERHVLLNEVKDIEQWKEARTAKRMAIKPDFLKLLSNVETPAGAVTFVAKHLNIGLTYCPYKISDILNLDELDRMVMGASISSIKDMTEVINENY